MEEVQKSDQVMPVAEKKKWPEEKDHLNKTYLEELAHKMWNTKGTRFAASARLLAINDLSNMANGFLSAYLIIYSLLAVYRISNAGLDENFIAFASTTLSILLLVFTQLEAAQDYKIRALGFHKCALEISELHDQIRILKTMETPSDEEKVKFCIDISAKYQVILRNYPNHDPIDYEYFKSMHQTYYKLTDKQVRKTRIKRYIRTQLVYHSLMVVPLLTILYYVIFT